MAARLQQIGAHLVAAQTQEDGGLAEDDAALSLLDDAQMADFVEQGYVLLPLDELPDEFHSDLYRKCEARFEETSGKNGKEIFKEIPELNRVLMSKTLQGGLTSVLGKDYTMHPARHMHVSGNNDGGFHKDGGHCSIRHHRQRWAMAMYYAGGCTVNMGPTSVIPGSQFLDVIEGKAGAGGRTTGGGPTPVDVDEEIRVVVPPGTILLRKCTRDPHTPYFLVMPLRDCLCLQTTTRSATAPPAANRRAPPGAACSSCSSRAALSRRSRVGTQLVTATHSRECPTIRHSPTAGTG